MNMPKVILKESGEKNVKDREKEKGRDHLKANEKGGNEKGGNDERKSNDYDFQLLIIDKNSLFPALPLDAKSAANSS